MKKLSLRQLNSNELEKREMNQLLGGENDGTCCFCGCGGSSSTAANGKANYDHGYGASNIPNGCGCFCTVGLEIMSNGQLGVRQY